MKIRVLNRKVKNVIYKYWSVDLRYETEEVKNNLIKSGLISKSLRIDLTQKNTQKNKLLIMLII